MTALKHVVREHDIATEHVSLLIRMQFLVLFHVLENLSRQDHAQNGAVQVLMDP